MRIAVVTNYFPCKEQPYRGHSAYQTVRCLLNYAEVEVFCPQLRYPSFLPPRHRPWAQTDTTFEVPDVSTTLFDYPAIPVFSRALNGLFCANSLEPYLRDRGFDLILSYWIYPDGFAAVRAGKKLGIPVILKAIGSDINEARGFTRMLSLSAMKGADLVLAVSEPLRRRIVGMGIPAGKVKAITNGCDTTIFHPRDRADARAELGLLQDKKYILYVGRLHAAKGLRELVRAAAELKTRMPDIRLIMIGEGPLRSELQGMIHSENLQGESAIMGPFPSEELGAWFAACDVFALPSYNEGCPNVVVEALNSGRPVVGSRVGGIPDLVSSDSGILVPSRNVEALARALEEALNTPWNYPAIAQSNQRSWNDVAMDVMALCRSAIGERTNP